MCDAVEVGGEREREREREREGERERERKKERNEERKKEKIQSFDNNLMGYHDTDNILKR